MNKRERERTRQTISYVIDGVRLGQNRKRPGSGRRYIIICPGTAVAAAVFDDRQDTTTTTTAAATAAADIYRTQYIIYPRHMACFHVPKSTTIFNVHDLYTNIIYEFIYIYIHGTYADNLLSHPLSPKKKNRHECYDDPTLCARVPYKRVNIYIYIYHIIYAYYTAIYIIIISIRDLCYC